MGTNKARTKQDNYTKATSQQRSERQLQDTGVLPGPKEKYHCCSSATGKKEREKAHTITEDLKSIPREPKLPTGPGLKCGIQLQRHLLLGSICIELHAQNPILITGNLVAVARGVLLSFLKTGT